MKRGLLALSPIVVLLVVYLAMSLASGDFYRISISVAFVAAAVYAVAMLRNISHSLQERVAIFSEGASDKNIMYMIWIFVLAGIFAATAKAMGAVDATVHFTMQLVPTEFLPAGIFVAACFVSLSIGTSVGTIVALTPVVTGLAAQMGVDTAQMVAIVVGGAFFGDNLSFISDTTIAATRTQGCTMRDKFRTNLRIVAPAAIITLLIYMFFSQGTLSYSAEGLSSAPWYTILPYILVMVMAIAGVNVLGVLTVGILSSGIIGLLCGRLTMLDWLSTMGEGIDSMGQLIIITMMAGGMLEMIRINGGVDYIIHSLTSRIRSRRGAELSIAALVAFADTCTANNTVAIISVGSIVREIAQRFGISPQRAASLLDTSSCFVQAIIPYGAQLLMAAGLAAISPVEIIGYLYYPLIMGLFALIAILLQWPRQHK